MSPNENTEASQSKSAPQAPMFMGGLPFPPMTLRNNPSPAIKYEGYHGTYLADPNQSTRFVPSRQLPNAPRPQGGPNLMSLPPELRLKIFTNVLKSSTGPSGTISTNPRARLLSDPQGEFRGHDCSGKGQTQWQARRGVLQSCRQMRAEVLEVLYHRHGFFARMSQCGEGEVSFERRRFERWLTAMGSDEEIRRVRRVVFGVEWTSVVGGDGGWVRRKGEVKVQFDGGGHRVVVGGSKRIAECAAEPLLQLEKFVAQMMFGRGVRREQGLGFEEWMKLWDKVQELIKSGWGSPY